MAIKSTMVCCCSLQVAAVLHGSTHRSQASRQRQHKSSSQHRPGLYFQKHRGLRHHNTTTEEGCAARIGSSLAAH